MYIIYNEGEFNYSVNPNTHHVEQPDRALEKYSSEALKASAKNFGIAICVFLILGIWSGLGAVSGKVVFTLNLRGLGGFIVAFLIFSFSLGWLGSWLVIVFHFLTNIYFGIKILFLAYKTPNRTTPESTLKIFFNSLSWGLYQRAYNCLSDSAKQVTIEFPKKDYLQKMMPEVRFDSLASFREFWTKIGFSSTFNSPLGSAWRYTSGWVTINPQFSSLKEEVIDTHLVKTQLNILILPRKTEGVTEEREREFICQFILVKKNNWWFLTNGFFWPLLKKEVSQGVKIKTKGSYKGNINKLINMLKNKSPRIREDTVKTLSEVGTMEAVEAIIEALKDENVQVRFAAVLSLRKINDTKVLDPLIAALEDKEDSVRENAAEALGELGDAGAIGPLINVLQKDENIVVQNAAAEALVNLTGNNFGLDTMRWQEWWQQSKVMQQKSNELDKKVNIDSVETYQAAKKTIPDKGIPLPHPPTSVEPAKTQEDERVSSPPKISISIVEDSKLKKYAEIYGRPLKTEETSIIDAWHRIVGESKKEVYTYPNIPEKKLSNAKVSFAKISPEELIIGIQDSTEFGSAKEGILATTKGIYWKSVGNLHSESVHYCDIDSCKVSYKRTMFSTWIIILGEERNIELSVSSKHLLEALSSFIAEAVLISKAGQNS